MRGIANAHKRRCIFDKHRPNADILCLQETHSSKEIESVWENEWGGKILFSHGTTAARGVAILMSKQIFQNINNVYLDEDGRVIICDLVQDETKITLVNIYAPNQDTPSFFSKIADMLSERHEHKIVLGDFNLVLDVELDRENTYNNNNKAKEEIENMCNQYCMTDLWRVIHQSKREFSWMKKNSKPLMASRIDFVLITGGIDQLVKDIQYISSIFTDHRAVYIVIDFNPFYRGIGYWKFNTSLLQNVEFVSQMNDVIDSHIKTTGHMTKIESWELLKTNIRNFSKKFSRQLSSENQLVICELSEKVNEYEARLPLDEYESKLLEDTRADLEDRCMDRIKGVMFRSKAQWYAEGEQSTKYFYNLEKARYNAKTCYKLLTEQGEEIEDPEQILLEQKNFYMNLYSQDEDVQFTLENHHDIHVPDFIQNEQVNKGDLETAI